MSIQRQVSIKRAVQQAMDNLGIETNDIIPKFQVWAVEAENRIGSYTQYERKIFVLDINGCTVELPCEVVAVNAVLIGDHGCNCGMTFRNVYTTLNSQSRTSSVFGFLVIDGGQVSMNTNISWTISDNHLVFSSSYPTGKITIETLSRRVDAIGWPLINENHVYPIAEFISWMYMKMARHKVGGYNYSRTEIQDQFMTWSRMAAHAHAQDGEPGPAQIASMVSLYNDPLSGLGNAFWLYQNPYYGLRSNI
jgi:hypothetical protein